MAENQMTPEEFKDMIKGKSDETILAGINGNEDILLDTLFEKMAEAFDPSSAAGQSAVIQYDIETPTGKAQYQLKVDGGECTVSKTCDETPRVTLMLNIPNFLRMMTGELNGQQAFMAGQLEISGDIMFSQNIAQWFKQSGS